MIWTHSRISRVDLNMDTTTRRTETEVQGFQASPELSANLQRVLVDLIELHLQGKQAHWNVVGTNFRDLHLQLDELVDFAREASDTIAERMRALDAVPDGRSDTVAATTTLPQFPAYEHSTTEVVDLITGRTYAAVDTIRTVHDGGRRRGPQHRRHPASADRRPGEAGLADQVGEPQGLVRPTADHVDRGVDQRVKDRGRGSAADEPGPHPMQAIAFWPRNYESPWRLGALAEHLKPSDLD